MTYQIATISVKIWDVGVSRSLNKGGFNLYLVKAGYRPRLISAVIFADIADNKQIQIALWPCLATSERASRVNASFTQ